ncbi:MAG: multicopper oxidase domain-containing protein, partial [Cyclobacteriaceae bacterium]|nr:multicopper oxidase domain-containing protein [Cyclobacteriaceae bacterium]
PGKSKTVSFLAGKPGTYLYWVKLGKGIGKFFSKSNFYGEEEQLSGAFIIDPKNSKVNDRIIVMNIFSTMEEPGNREKGSFESLTMNGKTWPFTELLKFDVGDSVQWRIINSSNRGHPMHLHGFYFKVNSIGSMLEDSYYEPKDVRTVVTESMAGKSTMVMSWVPSRPGRWIFHCHLSFHVSPLLRLPGATDMDPEGSHVHMSGLASGIEVNDGPTDLIEKGESRQVTIFANEYKNSRHHKGFSFQDIASDNADLTSAPGPLLILKRFQSTYVKVVNHLSDPTSVHWHGLELDAWADGVPQWSSSEGKQSPIIEPGEEFTYKLSAMRAGTFIYHSHLDDIHQITQGLYGPIIVLDENETFNAKLDHPYIVSWNASDDSGETFSFKNLELNGQVVQPEMKIKVGERHRLRLINISPAGKVNIQMTKNNEIIELLYLAKDGADLPQAQQIQLEKSPNYGPGETADFEFEPTEAGVYTLKIESKIFKQSWNQKWIVSN